MNTVLTKITKNNKVKKFIIFIGVILLIVFLIWFFINCIFSFEMPDGRIARYGKGYYYTIEDDDTITLLKYTKDDEIPVIPEIILGKKVTRLGQYSTWALTGGSRSVGVFKQKSILKINIPKNIISIESGVFYLSNVGEVEINSNMIDSGISIFSSCKSLKEVRLNGEIVVIPGYIFSGCISLEEIELPRSVQKIEKKAFASCRMLSKIIIYENVTEIAEDAFEKSTSVRIYGVAGSYAEEYANKMEIPFEEIENS